MRPLDLETRAPTRKPAAPKKKEPIAKPIKIEEYAATAPRRRVDLARAKKIKVSRCCCYWWVITY
jgi:hypothetical protein